MLKLSLLPSAPQASTCVLLLVLATLLASLFLVFNTKHKKKAFSVFMFVNAIYHI